MSRKAVAENMSMIELKVPAFGYELIREDLLNELLGEDTPDILYWAGKQIARKYPLFSINEIKEFFTNAGWGTLELIHEKKYEMEFTLSSDLIKNRLLTRTGATFQLEAGFLAEQIQQIRKVYTETYEHPKKKNGQVIFTVKWDTIPFNS